MMKGAMLICIVLLVLPESLLAGQSGIYKPISNNQRDHCIALDVLTILNAMAVF